MGCDSKNPVKITVGYSEGIFRVIILMYFPVFILHIDFYHYIFMETLKKI